MKKQPQGAERRKSPRRPIVETFSLFVVVPRKGDFRLKLHDASDHGIGFDVDMEGEEIGEENFPLQPGESLDVQFYLNPSLFLPLQVKITRIEKREGVRRVGGEIQNIKSKEYKAFLAFINMLDSLLETAQFTS